VLQIIDADKKRVEIKDHATTQTLVKSFHYFRRLRRGKRIVAAKLLLDSEEADGGG